MRDLSQCTTFPFELPIRVRPLDSPVAEEPARLGERGRECQSCERSDDEFLWVNDRWRLFHVTASPFVELILEGVLLPDLTPEEATASAAVARDLSYSEPE